MNVNDLPFNNSQGHVPPPHMPMGGGLGMENIYEQHHDSVQTAPVMPVIGHSGSSDLKQIHLQEWSQEEHGVASAKRQKTEKTE